MNTEHQQSATEQQTDTTAPSPIKWGPGSPRGGKTVVSRIMKDDKATVPLFLGQTMIQSLRDVGYNNTTYALLEHVDNAIQAGAEEVRVYFRQTGKRGDYRIDAAVYDDGSGMAPAVLKVATAFGGSTTFGNRQGIGRFGMGMKTAALSMSPRMELYSWQDRGTFYSMSLDVDAIGKDRRNLIELPEPVALQDLPDEVTEFLTKPMSYPTDRTAQQLFVSADEPALDRRLGESGTIVYMPNCDRLTYAKARTLVEHAAHEMARVYRRALSAGLKLFVNNQPIQAFDPMYAMPDAQHTRVVDIEPKTSRLIVTKSLPVRLSDKSEKADNITIKLYRLPIEEWSKLPRKVLRHDLHIFDDTPVSILRNDREVYSGPMSWLTTRHSVTHWYRVQIDFPGTLDEAFGVAANKQGVRLKGYVEDAIKLAIGDEITAINDEIKQYQAQQSPAPAAQPSPSEARANTVDSILTTQLPPSTSPDEEVQIDENLRGLAATLRRPDETEDQAFERVKSSKYLIQYKHDNYWPLYDVMHRFDRIILTINTAHPFYAALYEPVRNLGTSMNDNKDELASHPIVALDLLFLSLARAESQLATTDETRNVLDRLRREWSETYRIQLTA